MDNGGTTVILREFDKQGPTYRANTTGNDPIKRQRFWDTV